MWGWGQVEGCTGPRLREGAQPPRSLGDGGGGKCVSVGAALSCPLGGAVPAWPLIFLPLPLSWALPPWLWAHVVIPRACGATAAFVRLAASLAASPLYLWLVAGGPLAPPLLGATTDPHRGPNRFSSTPSCFSVDTNLVKAEVNPWGPAWTDRLRWPRQGRLLAGNGSTNSGPFLCPAISALSRL